MLNGMVPLLAATVLNERTAIEIEVAKKIYPEMKQKKVCKHFTFKAKEKYNFIIKGKIRLNGSFLYTV